jgi:hypothetical protein
MRRTYISPEYSNYRVYGTFNMVEESNFFGSKMLDIEDKISLQKQDIIYYQNLNGEQLDYSLESSLKSYVFSSSINKSENHKLEIDETQPKYQMDKNTKWILTINVEKILSDFIYAEMKKWRTFEGIKNEMTRYNNVNLALKSYIDNNVKDKYRLKNIDLYISYKDLRNQNILRFKNSWDSNVFLDSNKLIKLQRETSTDGSEVKLIFSQEKPSSDWSFNYFFNLNFEKI